MTGHILRHSMETRLGCVFSGTIAAEKELRVAGLRGLDVPMGLVNVLGQEI